MGLWGFEGFRALGQGLVSRALCRPGLNNVGAFIFRICYCYLLFIYLFFFFFGGGGGVVIVYF